MTVSVTWGSTFLSYKFALRWLPPLIMSAIRFVIGGAVVSAWALRAGSRDGPRPGLVEWRAAIVAGSVLFLVSNGCVVWSQQRMSSGLAGLLIATVPLWMAVVAITVLGERLNLKSLVGLAIGFGGLALLIDRPAGGPANGFAVGVALIGALAWAVGSLYAARAPLPRNTMLAAGMEMLAGGVLLAVAGALTGEFSRLDIGRVSPSAVLALLYLAIPCSLTFGTYLWLLRVASTVVVSSYAYITPMVAVFLGWLVLRERVTTWTLVGGVLVLLGVALIIMGRPKAPAMGETVPGTVQPARPSEYTAGTNSDLSTRAPDHSGPSVHDRGGGRAQHSGR